MDNRSKLPIGIFDSGVGGLTVATVLRSAFPHEDFVYIGDNANNPVGNRPDEEITEIALRIGKYLEKVPVKMAVVACNTFTVVALEALQAQCKYPILGVNSGMQTAVDISPRRKVGIMATTATIASHKHRDAALTLDSKLTVIEQPCPEFAQLIERGHITDELIEHKVEEYLRPLVEAQVDTIVLGCTHFPFIKKLMERVTGLDVVYVDPAHATAVDVGKMLDAYRMRNPQRTRGKLELCFTKDVDLAARLASRLIPPKEFEIRSVTL